MQKVAKTVRKSLTRGGEGWYIGGVARSVSKRSNETRMKEKPMNPHKNPYREGGNYNKLFAKIQSSNRIVTRPQMVAFAMTLLDDKGVPLTEKAANFSVTVIMSPRKESKRGDCRGNLSAQGHVYYMEKLAIGKLPEGLSQREHNKNRKFRLCWREPMLEPLIRVMKDKDGNPIAPKRAKKEKVETVAKESKVAKKVKVEAKAKTKKAVTSKKKPARKAKAKVEAPAEPENKVEASVDTAPTITAPTPDPVTATPAE